MSTNIQNDSLRHPQCPSLKNAVTQALSTALWIGYDVIKASHSVELQATFMLIDLSHSYINEMCCLLCQP